MKNIFSWLVLSVLILSLLIIPAAHAVTYEDIKETWGGGTSDGKMNQTPNFTAGPPGAGATVSVNDTFTIAPGTPANVVNIGTATAAELDFSIPQGVNGAPGAPGSPGAPGTTSHNFLENLTYDDHPQYILTDGTRIFTGSINGGLFTAQNFSDPVNNQDLITLNYLLVTIGNLSASSGGDLSEYLPLNGTSPMRGKFDAGGLNISNVSEPIQLNDAATRNFVLIQIGNDTSYATTANLSATNQTIQSQLTAKETIVNTSQMNSTIQTQFQSFAANDTLSVLIDGTKAMLANLNLNNYKILNLITGTTGDSAANKTYVDNVNTSMRTNVSTNFVPMVNNKTPTINLGGLGADATKFLRGDQTWAVPAGGSDPDAPEYLFRNLTRLLTGSTLSRSVNNSLITIRGSYPQAGNGSTIALYGSDSATTPGSINLTVPNVAKNTDLSVLYVAGNTNTPRVDFQGRNVSNAGDPVVNQDLATKKFVEDVNTTVRNNQTINFAPIVGGLVPTANLGGAGADSTKYLRGDQTWVAPPGGTGSSSRNYTIYVQALTSSPADNAMTYWGSIPAAPATSAGQRRVFIRRNGYLIGAEIYTYSGTAGTAQIWNMSVMRNGTTEKRFIANQLTSANERVFSNFTPGFAMYFQAGNELEIRSQQPGWTTNPATSIYGGYLYFNET